MSDDGPIVQQDDDFVYLRKHAGVPVFPPNDGTPGRSVFAELLSARPAQAAPSDTDAWPDGFAGGILHRLDEDTSGLVVAARSGAALDEGRAAFRSHQLRKRYLFLSDRDPGWERSSVGHRLAHDVRRKGRMIWERGASTPHRGRWFDATTELRLILRRDGLGLWEAVMGTGVTHQIRVHAASVGVALLGDRLYGGGPGPAGRFCLHHVTLGGWHRPCPALAPPADWPLRPEDD